MTTPHRFSRLLLLLACAAAAPLAGADTLTWNTTNGTWKIGTAGWINGSAVPWTSDADTALFPSITGTVTVDGSAGQVGAAGIASTGTGALTIKGDSLQIGTGGISTQAGTLAISSSLQLAGSQTWSSSAATLNSGAAGVAVTGPISGTGNLTFDGRGLGNASLVQNGDSRVTFSLGGTATSPAYSFSGSTTVTGGAVLRLDYTKSNTTRLDASSPLTLAGGTISLNGGTALTETVASTTLAAGANGIITGPNGGGTSTGSAHTFFNEIALGALTRSAGATLDVSSAANALASTTTQNTSGNILGGWATSGGTAWAVGSSDGSAAAITGISGTGRSAMTGATGWQTGDTVNATAGGTLDRDLTINALRIGTAGITADLGGHVVTISSGGVMAGAANGTISDGTLTTGMTTGELFVHTAVTASGVAEPLTIGAAIADNGTTAVSLVKDGASILTLSGTNTYTGTTYIDAGTVKVTGSIANTRGVIVQGGAVFDVTANGHVVGSGKFLSGGGTVQGNVSVASGGSLAPAFGYVDAAGASRVETGTMTLTGNLTLQNGSALSFDLGTNSDLLSLTGSAMTLTGSASVGGISLSLADAGGVVVGKTYTLMQWAGNDVLTSFDLTDFTVNGLSGTLNLDTVNDKLTFTVSAVPEPSALAFLALGLVALAAVVRRNHPGRAAA